MHPAKCVFQHSSLRVLCASEWSRKFKRICLAAACTKSKKSLWARMCLKSLEEKCVENDTLVCCMFLFTPQHTHWPTDALLHIQHLTHFNMLTEWTRDQPPRLTDCWMTIFLSPEPKPTDRGHHRVTTDHLYTTGWRKTSPVDNYASPPCM